LVARLIENRTVNVLVVGNVRGDVPLLINELKVVAEFLPASISLLECPFFPKLLVEELVDWRIGVDACARIAVPVPNTT
jgi:hypothetical protein